MSRTLLARFAKSSGSHFRFAVAVIEIGRCGARRARKAAGRNCAGLIRGAANSRNSSCGLISRSPVSHSTITPIEVSGGEASSSSVRPR